MITLYNLGIGGPLWRAQVSIQAWAFQRLIRVDYPFGDLRSAIIALLAAALRAAGNALAENILRRAAQGARFARGLTAADTMVAAGGR
jgi:hypothetical protein